jgi:DNA-binding MarR family transcriptional regulator
MGNLEFQMSLESEIKQTKGFESEKHKALINIIYTESWIRDKFNSTLKPYGLTTQQYNVLRILRGSSPEPLSTSSIRERMLDKMSDASRIVDRLHKKGWVSKVVCPSDKRLVDIEITDEGMEALAKIDTQNSFVEAFSNLTEAEAAELNRILDKARGTAE